MTRLFCIALLVLGASALQAQVSRASLQLSQHAVLKLEKRPFKAAGRTIKYAQKIPVTIDGKPIFGTDGELPKSVLTKATLVLNGVPIALQTSGMYEPWPGAEATEQLNPAFFHLVKAGTAYKLQAVFSDGAGSYGAEWRIAGQSATRTVLTTDEATVIGFLQHPKTR
jgi:hypothetical protein